MRARNRTYVKAAMKTVYTDRNFFSASAFFIILFDDEGSREYKCKMGEKERKKNEKMKSAFCEAIEREEGFLSRR